ncbi:putative ribonuclease H [Lupinus albus]|uniref:Putative ribonuclease H n=1 Tax=Lupinus albus TaxID=3870 RepID=A0A6A4NBV3_LUPAL|nr:putative ribonuclease H [Lupinus albus]
MISMVKDETHHLHAHKSCMWDRSLSLFLESDKDEDGGSNNQNGKRQLKLSNVGFTIFKRKSEEIESSSKGRSQFFQARKLEHLPYF